MYENGFGNHNPNDNLNENKDMQRTTSSYTYPMQQPGYQNSYGQSYNYAEEEHTTKKKPMRALALMCAAAVLISFGSITAYKAVKDNETLKTLFVNDKEEKSTEATKEETSTLNTVGENETLESSTAESSLNYSTGGESWISLAARSDALSIPDAVEKAMPSVVGISSTFTWESQYSGYGGMFGFGGGQTYEESGTATGTGIIMTSDGYVITNAHCIYESEYGGLAKEVNVVLADESEYEATVVGYDKEADLAVLKIGAKGLTPAEFGDSDDLKVGELVIAIGNPLGFELFGSVTCGIVSAMNRKVSINENEMTLIQTDAAINSGNSGGPLINSYGQVIGINSAKMSSSYSSSSASIEGLGFAIPMNSASQIIDDLINYGYVRGKPQIGIIGQNVSETVSEAYGIPVGVYVYSVSEGGAADQAGIEKGDVIIAINGETITDYDEMNAIKNNFKAGDTITLTITRNEQDYDVKVTLQEVQPEEQGLKAN